MAYTLIEGFDTYGTPADMQADPTLWPTPPTTSNAAIVPGFFGSGRALQLGNATSLQSIFCEPRAADSELFIAFDLMLTQRPTSLSRLVACREGTLTHSNIAVTTAGAIRMRRGTTQLGTDSTFTFATNTRYRIEMRTVIADTGGLIEVRVDGVSVASVTGVDTRDGSTGVAASIELASMIHSSGLGFTIFDNLTVNNTAGDAPTSWPGAKRIETIFPDSDASVQWTPSTGGLNYELVNDATPNLLTWVQSATVGHIDRYGLANLSGTPTSIDAVELVYRASRSDAGTRTMRGFVRSGTTTSNGATVTPPNVPSGQYYRHQVNRDPDTSASWTPAAINALEAGVEVMS